MRLRFSDSPINIHVKEAILQNNCFTLQVKCKNRLPPTRQDMAKIHNNYFSIAKAIVIILMVTGHSGCPPIIHKFIYSFHVPFFFICSGLFLRAASDYASCRQSCMKKVKGLYVPFLKWCLPFLLLHNVFYHVNLYNDSFGFQGQVSHLYSFKDYVHDALCLITRMEQIPELLGGFWFLKDLFIASLFTIFLTFIWKREDARSNLIKLSLLFACSIVFSYVPVDLYFFSLKHLFWGSTFLFSGYLLKNAKTVRTILLLCLVVFLIINLSPIELSYQASGVKLMSLTFITSVTGTLLVLKLSQILERTNYLKRFLYYTGNHTLAILGLHFLFFNLIDLLIIRLYGLPIEHLAEFPVIAGYRYFWIPYTVVGILFPLLAIYIYDRTKEKFCNN